MESTIAQKQSISLSNIDMHDIATTIILLYLFTNQGLVEPYNQKSQKFERMLAIQFS